jgi:hypothetical protein
MRSATLTSVALLCALSASCASANSEQDADESSSEVGAETESGAAWRPAAVSAPNGTGTYEVITGTQCSGDLLPGARPLGQRLEERFDAITSVAGYVCRPDRKDPTKVSDHSLGRALDLMTSNGDPVADYLVRNAAALGVQLVRWNRTEWRISQRGPQLERYDGANPHRDHVHVELTSKAAK